ncbi:hypothetical protein FNW02_27525 [Komarekiella sp. 'clone 1']|uniref:Uncharacterized protein n=1 Tax=Komarekiella delphini-convector SJRDD-AB1 TaxID=2593771 RepID=A0AA40T2C6_9NOST|nr:hypothetical protein [Komarekiella delphini-convector]MBD6619475.1 hypothetical protein [Komarekiella delphini-convector SJRDD-AB1]
MAKIVIFDFHLSDIGTFIHELASAEAETLSGGASVTGSPYTVARILTIHDGINRVETNYTAGGGIHDNNYNSIDNSDQVYIWAYGI